MSLVERDGQGGAPAAAAGGAAVSSLDDLRRLGGALADPVHFRYLESLSARLAEAPPGLRDLLQDRLNQALAGHAARMAATREAAEAALAALPSQPPLPPATAREARRLLAAGDHRAVHRLVARVASPTAPSPLAALNRHIAEATRRDADATSHPAPGPVELDSMRRFRETWSRIAAEDQVQRAMGRGPENAGPLNSQMLVLRSLALMRDLSPAYLRRFMAHAEALLWLEQESQRQATVETKPAKRSRATR